MGGRPVPTRAMPEVVARVGVDLEPVDVTDADDVRWLRACLPPDQPERAARLEAEMALAAMAPARLLQGDAVEVLPEAFAHVPADALPVVTTTWVLSRFSLEGRLRFLRRLEDAAARRAVAWVSVEGSEPRRRYRPLATAAPLATAPSASPCSSGHLCAPRPLAAAGRRANAWRGWPPTKAASSRLIRAGRPGSGADADRVPGVDRNDQADQARRPLRARTARPPRRSPRSGRGRWRAA